MEVISRLSREIPLHAAFLQISPLLTLPGHYLLQNHFSDSHFWFPEEVTKALNELFESERPYFFQQIPFHAAFLQTLPLSTLPDYYLLQNHFSDSHFRFPEEVAKRLNELLSQNSHIFFEVELDSYLKYGKNM